MKPDVADLEAQVTKSRATIKDLLVKLDRSNAEKDTLSEQLDTATLRYVKAEKKLDRAKSAQVQKLEQQALKNATARAPSAERGADEAGANGNSEALQLKHDEAVAVLSKQKEQLAAALAEIKSLQEQNTSLKARQETVTDEDYSRTDLFKYFKSQNEDLIKRINSLEVINKQLREEAEKLQSERTAFREQLTREAQAVSADLEEQLHQKDQDLTRIRSIRDDLNANLTIQKAKADQERTSSEHIKDLLSAKDDRIAGLELELERLRPTEDAAMSTPREDLEALPPADLITRYIKLEKDFELIKSEVPSVEKAYKKAVTLSQKKLTDMAALESKVVSLTAEKNKAEQKYFAARRDTDARINENKTLQMQNKTSSTIISQLKDVEAHTRILVTNLEKQLTEMKQSNVAILEENRKIKAASSDALRLHEALKSQASNLSSLVKAKDSAAHSFKEKVTACEQELEKVKARLEHALKERDNYKSRGSSDSEENLRVSHASFGLFWICPKLMVCVYRNLRSATFVTATSRTSPSRRADTSSVMSASKAESRTAGENVLPVARRSTRWTSCISTCNACHALHRPELRWSARCPGIQVSLRACHNRDACCRHWPSQTSSLPEEVELGSQHHRGAS